MILKSDTISSFLTTRIEAGDFPSAVYLVADDGQPVLADVLGHAVCEPELHSATLTTIYDLASLTKPLVTALLCALMIERRALDIERPVAFYLEEFKNEITVRQLLTHSAGLKAWMPLNVVTNGGSKRTLEVIAGLGLEAAPSSQVIYSDLGFVVLGKLIEKIAGARLDLVAAKNIFEPLNLQDTFFNPPRSLRCRIAASEKGNLHEREMARALTGIAEVNHAKWREDIIWGEVHDGNAFFLGGVAGHAGLFSTVQETALIARQFIPQYSQLLNDRTCREFSRNLTPGLNEARSIGWQLASTPASTGGDKMPSNSFGHLGFTGTSCWIDALHGRILILFTNRTHALLLPFANINDVRRRFNGLAIMELEN